jgi:N-acetylglucosaminyldiphosphoundecaprenol N-acetyl-beta-D-mannosaminyltransferase
MISKRVNILGVQVSAINMALAIETIDSWIARREHNYVCLTAAHVVMDGYWNPDVRRSINQAGMAAPDGMALVWLLQLRGYREVSRVYGPDLMLAICENSPSKSWRHFFYGGTPGTSEALIARFKIKNPDFQATGSYYPPFRPLTDAEDREIIDRINASRADIVWLGISSLEQIQWMAAHFGKLNTPVLIGVGAAFDFLSGRKPQAPQWIQRIGMEWLFRLTSEPRRLWRRYSQYPLFAVLSAAQALGITRYE